MEWKNKTVYPSSVSKFSDAKLLKITPTDVERFIALASYGKEIPEKGDNPTSGRSSNAAYYKKAISKFMPNPSPWVITSSGEGFGNPTRAKCVNDLIKSIKFKETRGLGLESKAERAYTMEEFNQIVKFFGMAGIGADVNGMVDSRRFQALAKLQFHMLARSDDMAHIKKANLTTSLQFPKYLTVKLRWSKNVREERDCPRQLILGSVDIN